MEVVWGDGEVTDRREELPPSMDDPGGQVLATLLGHPWGVGLFLRVGVAVASALSDLIHRYAKRAGKRIRGISKDMSNLLQSYDWPGNIRELQNVIERAVIVCDSDTLSIDPRWLSGRSLTISPVVSLATSTLATQEKDAIEAALTESKGRVSGPFGAAARLGVPSSTLESKIKALKIDKRRFKSG